LDLLDPPPKRVAQFLTSFVDHTLNHAELMGLDALGHGILERNLEPDTLVAFRQALSDRLMGVWSLLDRELELAPGRASSC
jgi:hypothetical protein